MTDLDNERLRKWLDAAVEGAYCAGAEQERAAVVAWIKRDALKEDRSYPQMVLMGWIAQEIERGEHRREEKA
jgi:hypothetical protein